MSFHQPTLALFGLGGSEILIVLLIVLLLFGGRKLPELARGMGKAIREFKKASSEAEDDIKKAVEAEEKKDDSKKSFQEQARDIDKPKS